MVMCPRGGIGIHSRLRACARKGVLVRVQSGASQFQNKERSCLRRRGFSRSIGTMVSRSLVHLYSQRAVVHSPNQHEVGGKAKVILAQPMVTTRSSIGCLFASNTRCPNSGNSSRNNTP